MQVKTTDSDSTVKFSSLNPSDVFRSKAGTVYMKTSEHHCWNNGEFRTNCIGMSSGTHSCYWNDDDVIPLTKIELTEE